MRRMLMGAVLALAAALPARAEYPEKPVTMIMPQIVHSAAIVAMSGKAS